MKKVKRTIGDIRKVYEILTKLLDLGRRCSVDGIIDNQDDYNEIFHLREKFKN